MLGLGGACLLHSHVLGPRRLLDQHLERVGLRARHVGDVGLEPAICDPGVAHGGTVGSRSVVGGKGGPRRRPIWRAGGVAAPPLLTRVDIEQRGAVAS